MQRKKKEIPDALCVRLPVKLRKKIAKEAASRGLSEGGFIRHTMELTMKRAG